MIDATFVQSIQDRAAPVKFEVTDANGTPSTFTSKPIHEVMAAPPSLPPTVSVFTLTGFADLVKAKLDDIQAVSGFLVHIEGPTTVTLESRFADKWGRRLELIKAEPVAYERFPFGKFLDQEEFIIQFASRFSPSADTDYGYIIDIASSITANAARHSTDNGLAQTTTLKRGLQVPKEDAQIKPRVKLAPYRIFPECQQPVSDFLFRLAGGNEQTPPKLALFEADGGQWKIAAIREVARFISALSLDVPIIS